MDQKRAPGLKYFWDPRIGEQEELGERDGDWETW